MNTDTPILVLTGSGARFFLRQIAEGSFPNLVALAHSEIPAGAKVISLAVIQ